MFNLTEYKIDGSQDYLLSADIIEVNSSKLKLNITAAFVKQPDGSLKRITFEKNQNMYVYEKI
jgi:hypothetical protein